jgi:hypothetical protein
MKSKSMMSKKAGTVILLIAVVDILASSFAIDNPITPPMSPVMQFINSIGLLIALLTLFPLGIPRVLILHIAFECFGLPIYAQTPGYTDSKRILLGLVADLLILYFYWRIFRMIRSYWHSRRVKSR